MYFSGYTVDGEKYALISHESAVEAIWSLAARNWQGIPKGSPIVEMVPGPLGCVTTQREYKRLAAEVDLGALGIRRSPVDLLVPDKTCCSRGKGARFHVWSGDVPIRSFVCVHKNVLVSTPYFSFVQIAMARRASRATKDEAAKLAKESAELCAKAGLDVEPPTYEELVSWKNIARTVRATQVLTDFMSTYRYVAQEDKQSPRDDDVLYDTEPLVNRAGLDEVLEDLRGRRGVTRARRVSELAFEGSASPMETMLALLISLPVEMGGYGLPRPELNREIPAHGERARSSKDRFFADLCWPEQQVVVEYYGWEEHFGAGPRKVADDCARANSLTALGWTVFHVTYEQVRYEKGATLLANQLAHALRVGLREPREVERIRRLRLMAMLMPSVRGYR